jgi:hypothetical protein
MNIRLEHATYRAAFTALLIAVSGGAAAEWVQVTSAESYRAYADQETIRKNGNRLEISGLVDYKTAIIPKGGKRYMYMSLKSRNEFDCQQELVRALSFSWYSRNMGEGKVVYSTSKAGEWKRVQSESVHNALMKVACEKP